MKYADYSSQPENFFAGCFTIDPAKTVEAWNTLSTDTTFVEVGVFAMMVERLIAKEAKKICSEATGA